MRLLSRGCPPRRLLGDVTFRMWTVKGSPVICRVDCEVLLDLEGRHPNWDALAVFDRNRDKIERAAARLYARGAIKPLVTLRSMKQRSKYVPSCSARRMRDLSRRA